MSQGKMTIIIITEKVCSFWVEATAVGDSLKCPCEMFISIPEASEQFSLYKNRLNVTENSEKHECQSPTFKHTP